MVDVNNNVYQISAFESADMSVISVYRSEAANLQMVLDDIIQIYTRCDPQKLCIIGGDFNLCFIKNGENAITTGLTYAGFEQVVKEATHELCGAIYHCYIKQPNRKSIYWSDHDAITVMVTK